MNEEQRAKEHCDFVAKAQCRQSMLNEILWRHRCVCGLKATFDVVIDEHTLEPLTVLTWCPCNGTGKVSGLTMQTPFDLLWQRELVAREALGREIPF